MTNLRENQAEKITSKREYVECLNAYSTDLRVYHLDGVYEGYRVRTSKWQSNPIHMDDEGNITFENTWYESSSNHPSSGATVYKTEDEMNAELDEWCEELNNK